MSKETNPSYRDEDYESYCAVGLPAGVTAPQPTAEELRQLEEAWNNTAAYNAAVTAHYRALEQQQALAVQTGASAVPKPSVEPSAAEPSCGVPDESVSAQH